MFEKCRTLQGGHIPEDDALLFHLAAVAVFRQGREEEARRYWQEALHAAPGFPLAQENLDDLNRPIRERNAPWSYPFNQFVPRKLIDGLVKQVLPGGGKAREEEVRRDAKRFLEAHPEMDGLVPLLLDRGDGPGRELALQLAGLFRTPVMLQVVHDFALGQQGPDKLRLQACQLATQSGLLSNGPHRLFLDGAWRDSGVLGIEIHTDVNERTQAPGVSDLVLQAITALREGNPAGAERVLRKALAIDPDDPVVMNNLALAVSQLGRTDESESLSIRLHERHPDYLFGRTALAGLASQRGDLERARKLLDPLLKRKRLHISEFSALCMAEVNLYLAEGNRQQVEHWVRMWRQAAPDHPGIGYFEEQLRSMPR